MTDQKRCNCFEKPHFSTEYIRNCKIIRESFRIGDSKDISCYSNWMKIGRCISGNGFVESGEMIYQYKTGDYFIILSNVNCFVRSESPNDSIWEMILISEQAVGFFFSSHNKELYERMIGRKERGIQIFHHLDKPEIGLSIHLLFGELENKGFMQYENLTCIIKMLIIYIIRDHQGIDIIEEKSKNDGFDYILPSIQYIMDHYKETIRISTLAKLCYVSESYYRKAFCEYLHVSPSEYINQFRINKACELMKTTNYPIDIISSEVGFQSVATFYRNFKRQKGCKPHQWKNDNL